jgi:hypothetical protein
MVYAEEFELRSVLLQFAGGKHEIVKEESESFGIGGALFQ